MAALQYWLWLSSAGLSPRAKAALLERFGDAEALFHAPKGAFEGIPGLSRAEAAVLERRDLSLAAEIREECERQGIRILTLQDAAYPPRLKHIFSPPVVLYVKGQLPVLEKNAPIAVIGTRHHSAYGLRMGAALAAEIAKCGGVVISLLTSGIEQEAARAAMSAGGACIGVLGTPHEQEGRQLAADVAAHGALVSEYPPFTRTLREFFRDRNRIASGLSAGVLVVEAPEKSGTQLFVAEAAEQGKEIFAVPGNADAAGSAGTLRMIQEGAKLVTSGWEIMSEFQPLYPETLHYVPASPRQPAGEESAATPAKAEEEKPTVDKPAKEDYDLKSQLAGLNETQLRIVAAIDSEAKHIDDIIEETELPAGTVLSQLTLLEIKGFVRHGPGQRFSLNIRKK